jgi:recombination protein RecR
MIVARDVDFETIEKSRAYNGLYFILGGTIPILEKDPEKRVRLKEISKRINGDIKEIIISMNSTSEGENTIDFLKQFIKEKFSNLNIKISTLGRGLSTGSELEYLDSDTIKNALENRKG